MSTGAPTSSAAAATLSRRSRSAASALSYGAATAGTPTTAAGPTCWSSRHALTAAAAPAAQGRLRQQGLPECLTAQRLLHQHDALGRRRQPEAFRPVRPQQLIDCMRRDVLGKLAPGGPVPRAGALNAAARVVPRHRCQRDRVPPQDAVLPELRRQNVQQEGRFPDDWVSSSVGWASLKPRLRRGARPPRRASCRCAPAGRRLTGTPPGCAAPEPQEGSGMNGGMA
jgi:hypothetical protein